MEHFLLESFSLARDNLEILDLTAQRLIIPDVKYSIILVYISILYFPSSLRF